MAHKAGKSSGYNHISPSIQQDFRHSTICHNSIITTVRSVRKVRDKSWDKQLFQIRRVSTSNAWRPPLYVMSLAAPKPVASTTQQPSPSTAAGRLLCTKSLVQANHANAPIPTYSTTCMFSQCASRSRITTRSHTTRSRVDGPQKKKRVKGKDCEKSGTER